MKRVLLMRPGLIKPDEVRLAEFRPADIHNAMRKAIENIHERPRHGPGVVSPDGPPGSEQAPYAMRNWQEWYSAAVYPNAETNDLHYRVGGWDILRQGHNNYCRPVGSVHGEPNPFEMPAEDIFYSVMRDKMGHTPDNAYSVRQVLKNTEFAVGAPFAVITAALFLGEVSRNRMTFLVNLMSFDLIDSDKDTMTWDTMLRGDHSMARGGATEELGDEIGGIGGPLGSSVRDKEIEVAMRWLDKVVDSRDLEVSSDDVGKPVEGFTLTPAANAPADQQVVERLFTRLVESFPEDQHQRPKIEPE